MEKTHDFEMFSPAGNRACQAAVNSISKTILGPRRIKPEGLASAFEEALKRISVKHSEVHDSEPPYHMSHLINRALEKAGYSFRIDGYGHVN